MRVRRDAGRFVLPAQYSSGRRHGSIKAAKQLQKLFDRVPWSGVTRGGWHRDHRQGLERSACDCRPSPTWRSFLHNHLPDIAAIDMFVVVTATFRLLSALIVLSLDRRRIVHFEVTVNPTQVWLSGQITEAFRWDSAPRYLMRDRDKSYGPAFRYRVRAMGITEVNTAPRSPWQNPYVEHLIGAIRRECLDHVIILNDRHLRRVLSSYFQYHHGARTHLSLAMRCGARTRSGGPRHSPAATTDCPHGHYTAETIAKPRRDGIFCVPRHCYTAWHIDTPPRPIREITGPNTCWSRTAPVPHPMSHVIGHTGDSETARRLHTRSSITLVRTSSSIKRQMRST